MVKSKGRLSVDLRDRYSKQSCAIQKDVPRASVNLTARQVHQDFKSLDGVARVVFSPTALAVPKLIRVRSRIFVFARHETLLGRCCRGKGGCEDDNRS